MSALLLQAELIKLSRLLGAPEKDLAFLANESVAELRALRGAIARSMVEEDRALFGRVVAAARLLPAAVIATIAERVMGPAICARIAGLLDAGQVVDVAKRLSTPFLAEVCLQLDPRSAAATLARMPQPIVLAVAAELLRRGEHLTMARLVEFIADDAVAAVARAIPDAAVLRVGFFVESPERLDELVGLFDDRRIRAIVAATLDDPAHLWPQALSLMEQVGDEARGRLARLGLAGQERALASLLQTAREQNLHESLLRVIRELDPAILETLGASPQLADAALVGPLFESAVNAGTLGYLLPLARVLPEATRQTLAEALQRQPASRLQALVQQLDRPPFAEALRRDWAVIRTLLPEGARPGFATIGLR